MNQSAHHFELMVETGMVVCCHDHNISVSSTDGRGRVSSSMTSSSKWSVKCYYTFPCKSSILDSSHKLSRLANQATVLQSMGESEFSQKKKQSNLFRLRSSQAPRIKPPLFNHSIQQRTWRVSSTPFNCINCITIVRNQSTEPFCVTSKHPPG